MSLSAPALAGSVGIPRNYATTQSSAETIAKLEQASETAQREAREGNKDNFAFVRKSLEIDHLIQRMDSGQQVAQNQIDAALQPVQVW